MVKVFKEVFLDDLIVGVCFRIILDDSTDVVWSLAVFLSSTDAGLVFIKLIAGKDAPGHVLVVSVSHEFIEVWLILLNLIV